MRLGSSSGNPEMPPPITGSSEDPDGGVFSNPKEMSPNQASEDPDGLIFPNQKKTSPNQAFAGIPGKTLWVSIQKS